MIAQLVLLFCLAFLQEVAYVRWTLSAVAGDRLLAAVYSGSIQLVALVGLWLVIHSPLLIVPSILGHAVGSFLTVGDKTK